MDKDLAPVIHDILQAINRVQTATAGKSLVEFSADWQLSYAVQRVIEIISEAARRIPQDKRATRPEIPWRQVMGIGNVLRHEYQGLSDSVIRGVVIDEPPNLKLAIEHIARELGS